MKKGWQGGTNPFITPMEKSIENAINVVVYHLNKLIARQGDGAGFLAMLDDFLAPANRVINLGGKQIGDLEAQTILTADFVSLFGDMTKVLDGFDSLSRLVHTVNSEEYNLIWGRTRNRFYNGSYQQILAALTGLSNEMTGQGVPDGATAVLDFRDKIVLKQKTQTKKMATLGTDSTSLAAAIQVCIKKLNKNRAWIMYNYADADDCQRQVNKFFPLNILGDRSVKGHHQLVIPHANFRKVCIHTFKSGEMVDIITGETDVWISTADNADNPIASGYKAVAHSKVRIKPSDLGDLTKKYIIATNVNLTVSTDLIFNIVTPKKMEDTQK